MKRTGTFNFSLVKLVFRSVFGIFICCFIFLSCSHKTNELMSHDTYHQNSVKKTNPILRGKFLVKGLGHAQHQLIPSWAQASLLDARQDVWSVVVKSSESDTNFSAQEKILLEKLQNSAQMVEPVRSLHILATRPSKDPKWLQQWALNNYGQDAPNGISGVEQADISAQKAWELAQGSRQVIVAVMDTGIDYDHPDLKENIFINEKELHGLPGVDDDGDGYVDDIHGWNFISDNRDELFYGKVGDPNPMDDNGHGTHCAGIIGAVGNNSIGISGVNWKVSLMPIKFLDNLGSGSTIDEYRALRFAIDQHVDVISASYGGGNSSTLIKSLLEEANQKGILFVAAAGNDSENNDLKDSFPANYDVENIISVAASDNRDNIATFSNYGFEKVDIAAPGVAIMSTVPRNSRYAKNNGEPYAVFSGTSMATPYVAGAAALLLSSDTSLKNQPALIKRRLMNNVDRVPGLVGKVTSNGRLNIFKALKNKDNQETSLTNNDHWIEEEVHIESPKTPTEKLIASYSIERQDATMMRVHIKRSLIDTDFDKAIIFNNKYAPVFELPSDVGDYWTAPIATNAVHIMFSNAMVAINDGEPFANFTSEGFLIDKISYLK